jgi:hypothetical protein
MAANQFGIDLADLYRTTTAVKGARTRNRLSELQLQETEREIAERPERERKAQERQNMLTGLRQQAVAGDENAAQQLLALDPEGGATFIDAVGKMDDRKREAAQRSVDEMGQLSAYVLQGKTPEEQQRRYQLMYQGVSPEVQAKLPEQYDPQFMELSLSKAMAMDKILENPKAIQVGGEDIVFKGGREVERKTRPVKASGTGSDGGGVKSADESLMYRQSVELLGGLFDQAGNITNLDPTVRNKVQGIATEATKIFREGGVTRSQAVKQAAQKFGLEVPDAGSTVDNNDPLGLR